MNEIWLGSTQVSDAVYKVSMISAIHFSRRWFLKIFTMQLGMRAILVM